MATSILTDVVQDPAGNVVATSSGTTVRFRLMANGSPTPGFRISDNVNVASLIVTSASTAGAISQALENNTNITPTGTYYLAEILCPTSQGGTQEWAMISSSSVSPQTFKQALAAVIPSFTPITTVPASVLAANGIYTGTNQFNGDVFFGSGRPWIDVRRYGAVGNGVADDTTSVQNAITAAATAKFGVYFPAGTYLITGSLTGLAQVRIFGAGKAATILKMTGAGTKLTLGNRSSIGYMKLQGDGTAGNIGIGFPTSGVSGRIRMEEIEVTGFDVGIEANAATVADGVILTDLVEVLVNGCTSAGVYLSGFNANVWNFYGGEIQGNGKGVLIDTGPHYGITFWGTSIEGSITHGIHVSMSSSDATKVLRGFRCFANFESNGSFDVYFRSFYSEAPQFASSHVSTQVAVCIAESKRAVVDGCALDTGGTVAHRVGLAIGRAATDGALPLSSTVTSSAIGFSSNGDNGKTITVTGAGPAGVPLTATIIAATSGTGTAFLSSTASVAVTNATVIVQNSGTPLDTTVGTNYFANGDFYTNRAAFDLGSNTQVYGGNQLVPGVMPNGVSLSGKRSDGTAISLIGIPASSNQVQMTSGVSSASTSGPAWTFYGADGGRVSQFVPGGVGFAGLGLASAGATVWSGAAGPSSDMGATGDLYCRPDTVPASTTNLYKKLAAGQWTPIL